MADCLKGLLSDPEELRALRGAGANRAGMFSWEKTALETRAVYHGVM